MKRFCALLLVFLLLCPAALTEAYDGYRLDMSYASRIVLLTEHDLLATRAEYTGASDSAMHILWWKDHQVYRDLPFSVGGAVAALNTAEFLVEGDGSFKVAVRWWQGEPPEDARNCYNRCCLYDWTDRGLENPIELPVQRGQSTLNTNDFHVYGRFAVETLKDTPDKQTLVLYDSRGGVACRFTADLPYHFVLTDLAELSDGVFAAVFINWKRVTEDYLILCFDGQGLRWQRKAPSVAQLSPDGRGGAVLTEGQKGSKYDPYSLVLLDENGAETARKQIAGNKVVVNLECPLWDAQSRTFSFLGFAVANSRGLYAVFQLTCDEGLNPIAWDVRSLDASFGDYSPKLFRAPSGRAFVYTYDIARNTGSALVPFDVLPKTDNPGLTLQ